MGVVLADIGGGTTDVAVFENGAVNFTRSIPIAGHHFTSDLATGLGISPSAAEWAKLTKADLEVDSINQRESLTLDIGEGKEAPVSRRVFNRLLRDRALDLVQMFLYPAGRERNEAHPIRRDRAHRGKRRPAGARGPVRRVRQVFGSHRQACPTVGPA